jgi:ABC-type bacteriocin/lantibiotic exporter with double-glycine peptidase domain
MNIKILTPLLMSRKLHGVFAALSISVAILELTIFAFLANTLARLAASPTGQTQYTNTLISELSRALSTLPTDSLSVLIFIALSAQAILKLQQKNLGTKLANTFLLNIRVKLFETLINKADQITNLEQRKSFLSIVLKEAEGVAAAYSSLINLVSNAVLGFCILLALMTQRLELTIIIVIGIVFSLFLIKLKFTKTKKLSSINTRLRDRVQQLITERVYNAPHIVLNSAQQKEFRRVEAALEKDTNRFLQLKNYMNLSELHSDLVFAAFFTIIFFLIVTLLDSSYSVAEIAFLLVSTLRITPLLKEIIKSVQAINSYYGSVESIVDVLQENETSCIIAQDPVIAHGLDIDSVSIKDIAYCYPGMKNPTINSLNLTLTSGRVVFLRGPNGSGKSTLLNLLSGQIRPTKGEIVFFDKNRQSYDIKNYRELIFMLGQESQFLTSSIFDYLAYTQPVSLEDVYSALSEVGMLDAIKSLPLGIDTILNSVQKNLSGGQIQKLNIARYLMSTRHLILLDEPTSAVAAQDERPIVSLICNNIRRLNQIGLVVIHTSDYDALADEIILLK